MNRRTALKSLGLGWAVAGLQAALPQMKITRIRYYHVGGEGARPIFNQSSHIVTVETAQGITGIGEGGIRTPSSSSPGSSSTRIHHASNTCGS